MDDDEHCKKAGPPPLREAELALPDGALLDRMCQCYEHIPRDTLVSAVAKLKWAQQYGQYGDRTDPFDPSGEPLRFSRTIDHWLWALDFKNAGIGNAKALQRYARKPKAIVILGNPRYIKGNEVAKSFYREIRSILEDAGYSVEFDPGKPYTSPPEADLWVGHSRGTDRLRFAPEGTRTIALGVADGLHHPKDNTIGAQPTQSLVPNEYHYVLTNEMQRALSEPFRRLAKHDPSRNEYQKKYQKNRYHQRKKEAIKMLGGKCSVCGTTKSLELDHKNPDNKSFNITKLWSVPEAEFKKEVRKCKLLCSKHHRERTGKQRENGEVKSVPGKTQYDSKGRKTKTRKKKTAESSHGKRVTKKEALQLGEDLGVDWSKVDINQFCEGIYVEQEHTDDLAVAAKIAMDHLMERRDYYTQLRTVEGARLRTLAARVAGVIRDLSTKRVAKVSPEEKKVFGELAYLFMPIESLLEKPEDHPAHKEDLIAWIKKSGGIRDFLRWQLQELDDQGQSRLQFLKKLHNALYRLAKRYGEI